MKIFVADFETTVDERPELQEETEVWAFGIARLFDPTDKVYVDNRIEKFLDFIKFQKDDHVICYFVNLKFDGCFLIYHFLEKAGFKNGYDEEKKEFKKNKDLNDHEMSYIITDLGAWYSVTIKIGKKIIEFRDLLKLLPFSVRDLGEKFETKHRKLSIEYTGNMKAGGKITEEQERYIINDILVPKEALEKFLKEMHYTKNPPLTLGQAAMREFKKLYSKEQWDLYFPDLSEIKLERELFHCENADEYCRRAYGGGWCYADERFTGIANGKTKVLDVNSLYPSIMHSSNKPPIGNPFPVGKPTFFRDEKTFFEIRNAPQRYYYFIQFTCSFRLRGGKLPFVQIKNDFNYRRNENLSTSSRDRYGHFAPELRPEMIMTGDIFDLFLQSYQVKHMKILSGCYFEVEHGIFDPYINHFMKMKIEAEENGNQVRRQIAKLFMNIIYGKFGTAPQNGFFLVRNGFENEEDIRYTPIEGNDKKPVFVPIAAAITSAAKCFTIRAALANEKVYPGSFRYSDTDSLHLVLPEGKEPVGIIIHKNKLSCWKIEREIDHSLFIRQKTYIEWNDSDDPNDIEIRAGGLPERSKDLLKASILGIEPDLEGNLIVGENQYKIDSEEGLFISDKRSPEDFVQGLQIPGKLMPKKIKGGCILIKDHFTII